MTPDTAQVEAFYRAALVGLRCLDAAQERASRFGAGPDAGWNGFRGHLTTADRIDLLCRDAAVKWRAAFSPALVFGLPGLAPDEPFGPDWQDLEEREAQSLWREAEALGAIDAPSSLAHIAQALSVDKDAIETARASSNDRLRGIDVRTRILVGGPAAIMALAFAVAPRDDIRWSEQVTVVADTPAERQLAGLIAPVLQASKATPMVDPAALESSEASAPYDTRLLSEDAAPTVMRALEQPSGTTV